jgi:hypothetical protein
LESETTEAKSAQVDQAIQKLFAGQQDPAIVPQTGGSNRMDADSEQAMTDANLSEHTKNVLRALNLSSEELISMLRSLRESKARN